MKISKYIGLVAITFACYTPGFGVAQDAQPEMRVLEWPDGTRFEGGILNGKKEGPGTIFWPDGTRFEGTFSNDMRDGEGTMTFPDGTVITGIFSEDRLMVTGTESAAETENTMETQIGTATATEEEVPAQPARASATSLESGVAQEPAEPVVDEVESELIAEPNPVPDTVPDVITEAEAAPVEQDPEPAVTETVAETDDQPDAAVEPGIEIAEAPAIAPVVNPANEEEATSPLYVVRVQSVRAQSPIFTYELEDEIVAVIDAWARAWSAQNPELYLSFYSEDFQLPEGLSRQAWENQRRNRIRSPEFIQVDVGYGQFELVDEDLIEVYVRQGYSSDTYSDFTNKMMRLQREDNLWKIVLEESL